MKKLFATALLLAAGSANAFFDFAIGDVTDNGDGSATLTTATTVTAAQIESFAFLDAGTLDGIAADLNGAANATVGSAADAFVTLAAGDTVSFDWAFFTSEDAGEAFYTDFAFAYIVFDDAELLGSTLSVDTFGVDSGTYSFSNIGFGGEISLFIGGGVMNVGDTLFDSALDIGNLTIVPTPAPLLLLGLGLVGLGAARRRA